MPLGALMPRLEPYLFLDTETGGLDHTRHSLLTLGMVVGDGPVRVDQREFQIRHKEYSVTASALGVNKIDLVAHDRHAVDPKDAWQGMQTFLTNHFAPDTSIILVGHNIAFDRAFLSTFLRSLGADIEEHFSHRSIDTHAVAAALRDAGRIPAHVSLNSSALFDYFNIAIPVGSRHTALGDAITTFELYWRLVDLVR